jgi:L-fucose mutarotase
VIGLAFDRPGVDRPGIDGREPCHVRYRNRFQEVPVLIGIDPLLTGDLLAALDAMGHSDAVVLADAHFPAERLADRLVVIPGVTTPDLLRAVCTVVPLDDAPSLDLMESADGEVLPVQHELLSVAGLEPDQAQFLDRQRFYDAAASAYLVVRTGETRTYGNVALRKGVVTADVGRA